MTRPKVTLAFITSETKRKKAYTKRMKGFQKKMEELSTLCGVETCAIISSEYKTEPVFWPSRPDVERLVNNYRNMPEVEQTRKQYTLSSFSQQQVAKTHLELNRELKDNREKQMKEVMLGYLAGTVNLDNCDFQDLDDLGWVIDKTIKEIDESIEVLNKGAAPSQLVQGTASSAAEVVAGEPTQPYGGSGTNATGAITGEPVQLYGTTNAASNMVGEPTQSSYRWGSFTQLLVGESSSSDDDAGRHFPGESSTGNAVGGIAGGWSDAAAGGASTSDAARSGAGASTQN